MLTYNYILPLIVFVLLLLVQTYESNSLHQSSFDVINSEQQHQLEDDLYNAVQTFLDPKDPEDAKKNCDSCISLLKLAKRLCFFPESIQILVMIDMCKKTKQVDNDVCEGVVREQGPVVRRVLQTMDISGRDGHLACASVLNTCPYPDVIPWQVPFPKPRPTHVPRKNSSGETMNVLHLSDYHIDPLYTEGAETKCSKPICCRNEHSEGAADTLDKASPWGSFNCDSPLLLVESMLEYIPQVTPNTSFAILTGDIPPHEVWETLPIEKTEVIQNTAYELMHLHFDTPFLINTKLYPAIGNHESAPTNLFPLHDSNLPSGKRHDDLSMSWLYRSFQENWKGWIDEEHLKNVHNLSGSYITYPTHGLKLISINTNFCYNLNWWLYQHPVPRDPNGILIWLVGQLQMSEDLNEKVWIIGHTPPGDSSCLHDYSNYYYQIVERYAPHVIAGQFFGHTHRDEVQIFYKNGSGKAMDAISMAYLGPSITPFPNLNPGFRVYTVDTGTFEVLDSHTYIAPLEKSTDWEHVLDWHKEYSAEELYHTVENPFKPLSPSWWHQVTEEMEVNDDLFDAYWHNRYKQSSITPECDLTCRVNAICTIRAGKSELRCDYEPTSPDDNKPIILNRKDKEACGIDLLVKNHNSNPRF